MNMILTRIGKIFLTTVLILTLGSKARSQVLVAGDIAFTGYVSAATNVDSFAFVLLVNIPAGTQINFTDNGWLNPGVFRVGEQNLTWTAGQAFVAGTEIKISGTTSPTPLTPVAEYLSGGVLLSAGTCTGTMLNLSTSGDQIIAYQGSIASPTIISMIHMNTYSTPLFWGLRDYHSRLLGSGLY
ncbi:MAG: hypothetical protein IPP31_01075 [Chitinophagaceae bacterium]|nr:hypothetical protein [Chitinophagaceae bacterium]